VIGKTLREELFGASAPSGQWLRIGDRRFRVIGILESEGRSIGVDTDETIIIPVAAAQQLLNTQSLFRILVEARSREDIAPVRDFVEEIIAERHQGERDVTVVTQDAVLSTFDDILGALTLAVGGIAAISLAVAGILIMNVMLVAVSERTAEIGLLKAIGATPRQILLLILAEASLLSLLGALAGIALGEAGSLALRVALPTLPAHAPTWVIGRGPDRGHGHGHRVQPAACAQRGTAGSRPRAVAEIRRENRGLSLPDQQFPDRAPRAQSAHGPGYRRGYRRRRPAHVHRRGPAAVRTGPVHAVRHHDRRGQSRARPRRREPAWASSARSAR
jgi:hypothetical protein